MKKVSNMVNLPFSEKLLFRVKPDLINSATDVQSVIRNCSVCNKPNIIMWKYKVRGIQEQYCVNDICTDCNNRRAATKYTDELIEEREKAVESKWFLISDTDQSGFRNFEITNEVTKFALVVAEDYTRYVLSGQKQNLLIRGSEGTGKSHIAKTIAKSAKMMGFKVAYIESVILFSMISSLAENLRHTKMFFDEYHSFDLVVIDDVGLEMKKPNGFSPTFALWEQLLNKREGKSTVYVSNFGEKQLPVYIGKRANSRMSYGASKIDLFTDDYRTRKLL